MSDGHWQCFQVDLGRSAATCRKTSLRKNKDKGSRSESVFTRYEMGEVGVVVHLDRPRKIGVSRRGA